jgi:hypothetical protein
MRRGRPQQVRAAILLIPMLLLSCYEQPAIPRDKPLACDDPTDEAECPTGFRCVANRCATLSCDSDDECPIGLVCNMRTGCGLPAPDGGADGGDGGIVIGEPLTPPDAGGGADRAGSTLPDAPVPPATTFDAQGGS